MAHFIGYVAGSRAPVSRLGTKSSGLLATAQGWTLGATVRVSHFQGEDRVSIYLTPGSSGGGSDLFLGEFTQANFDALRSGKKVTLPKGGN